MSQQVELQDVLEILNGDEFTGFGVAKVLGEILKANGRDVPAHLPQMMYNYLRNGLIVRGQKIFGPSLRKITKDELAAFLVRYCNKHDLAIKVSNPDQLELPFEEIATA
jgi:hypothetical protein